jgi:transposase-like protein
MREWHWYTPEFRKKAVARFKGCMNVEALARELKASRRSLYSWRT